MRLASIPANLAWLNGDPATGYVGWAFYRHEAGWHFPITWATRIGWPLGVTISWLDSIPLVAVLLRPFSPRSCRSHSSTSACGRAC